MAKNENSCIDLILVDRTTPLYKDISEIKTEELLQQRFKRAPFDEETEEMQFSVDEKDVCPLQS